MPFLSGSPSVSPLQVLTAHLQLLAEKVGKGNPPDVATTTATARLQLLCGLRPAHRAVAYRFLFHACFTRSFREAMICRGICMIPLPLPATNHSLIAAPSGREQGCGVQRCRPDSGMCGGQVVPHPHGAVTHLPCQNGACHAAPFPTLEQLCCLFSPHRHGAPLFVP